MEYIFIFANGGWWLKIDSVEKLTDYHMKTGNGRYENAFSMYLHGGRPEEVLKNMSLEDRIAKMNDRNFKYMQAAVMQAEKDNGTIMDGFRWMNMEIGMNQLRHIQQHGAVYINCVGGHTFGLEYTQFCRRKELVYPDFKKADIRIKQFDGGEHFYAYIGDMQIHDEGQIKWNSHEEAYKKALELIS